MNKWTQTWHCSFRGREWDYRGRGLIKVFIIWIMVNEGSRIVDWYSSGGHNHGSVSELQSYCIVVQPDKPAGKATTAFSVWPWVECIIALINHNIIFTHHHRKQSWHLIRNLSNRHHPYTSLHHSVSVFNHFAIFVYYSSQTVIIGGDVADLGAYVECFQKWDLIPNV